MRNEMGKTDRRTFLQSAMALGAGGAAMPLAGLLPGSALAQSDQKVVFATWSAAVDQVKSHISAFEASAKVGVAYENAPGAQFRQFLTTKFVGKAPLDVMWVSDAWLPEFADAGWLAPIDKYPSLTKYNEDLQKYCVDSMTYKGRQYGNVYYTDFMAFLYNEEILEKAGISRPPTTWDEVVEQSIKIKQKKLADFPMLLSLEADATWFIEFVSTLVFSFGGKLVDPSGKSVMQDPKGGAAAAMKWVQDAIQKHKIVSPAALSTSEINGLKAFGSGQHAFGIIPRYRIRPLNSPAESKVAGKVRMALMPKGGPSGTNATCGWVRFYGLSASAQRDAAKLANCLKLIEWFGGRAMGDYKFQKMILLDVGLPYCTKPLDSDPDVVKFYNTYLGGSDTVHKQAALTVKKDVIAPWFGEWNEDNIRGWQKGFMNQGSITDILADSGRQWDTLAARK